MIPAQHRTSTARQVLRATRMALHLLRGLATTTLLFPFASAQGRRTHIRRWSARLLALLAIEPRVDGAFEGATGNVLFVANHVSWLDIFVIDAHVPARFIAKSELARWPLIGRLIRDTGTIFLERARKADMTRVNALATAALREGGCLAVFPEGTTTDGTTLLRFHGSLLQPVIDARGVVQPVALRYTYADGTHSLAPEYAGDTSFMRSFWRVCGVRAHVVEIAAHAPIEAAARTRRALADAAEMAIRDGLGLPASATAPGTAGRSPGPRP